MSIEIKLTFDTTAEAVAFLSKTLPAETPAPAQHSAAKAKPEPAKPEPAKTEPAKTEPAKPEPAKPEPPARHDLYIDYDTEVKPRVLKVAKRPGVGMAMIQHLFARAGVSNAQQLKPEYYPHFLKLLDLADAAEDEDSLQDAIADLPDSELAV